LSRSEVGCLENFLSFGTGGIRFVDGIEGGREGLGGMGMEMEMEVEMETEMARATQRSCFDTCINIHRTSHHSQTNRT
jgi:hypothetical protein